MKRVIFVLSMTLVSTSAFGWGLSWESVSSWGQETIEPIRYNIEAAGNNIRVYEWVTPTAPHQKCVMTATENDTELQCDLVDINDVEPPEMVNQGQ